MMTTMRRGVVLAFGLPLVGGAPTPVARAGERLDAVKALGETLARAGSTTEEKWAAWRGFKALLARKPKPYPPADREDYGAAWGSYRRIVSGVARILQPEAAAALGKLAALTAPDSNAPWETRWKAYREAKDLLEGHEGPATDLYDGLRAQVAKGLRRDAIPLGGILMGVFAALLLWGGFAYCLRVAMRKDPDIDEPLDEDETWPLRPEEP
ncbi:MAG: MetS family NSS transporter small subunit [Planctomycetota bacterium]